jgi:acyl-CoA thioesterase-1
MRWARSCAAVILAVLVAASIASDVRAETIRIVALGASNTAGKGVGQAAAWPARLESMLRAKGRDVKVINAGISGDDTSRMRARLDSAVPAGTRLVIMEKAATNDRLRGVDTAANISAITAALRARHIRTIIIPGMHGWAQRRLQPDGIHITEAGHAAVAARLLPQVEAAIGQSGRR